MGDEDPKLDKGKGKVSEDEDGMHFSGASGSEAENPDLDAPRFVNLPRRSSFRGSYVLRLQAPASRNSLSVQPRRSGFGCRLCRLPFGACSCWDDQYPDNSGQNAPRHAAPVVLGLPPPQPHHQPPPPVGAGLQQLQDQPAVAAENPRCDKGKEKEKTSASEDKDIGNQSSGESGARAGNPGQDAAPRSTSTLVVNLPPLGYQQPGANSFRGGHGFQFQFHAPAPGNSLLQLQHNPRQNARPFEPVLKQARIPSFVCLACDLPFGSCACWGDQFLDNPRQNGPRPAAPVVGANVLQLGLVLDPVPPADQPGPGNEGLKCSACRYHPVPPEAQPRPHTCVCDSCKSNGIFCSVCDFGP